MSMRQRKNASLDTIMDDACCAVAEYAKWPNVAARVEIADRELSYLRTALHGHDVTVQRAMLLLSVSRYLQSCSDHDLDGKPAAIRLGLLKLADVLAEPQS